jgi:hypothetical protein
MESAIVKNPKNTIKIKLLDKIMLGSILPAEGNIKTLTIVKDIREKIQVTQDEISKFEIQSTGASLTWNEKGTKAEFDLDLTELEKIEIKLCLQKLDREKKLSVDMLSLVELFGVTGE